MQWMGTGRECDLGPQEKSEEAPGQTVQGERGGKRSVSVESASWTWVREVCRRLRCVVMGLSCCANLSTENQRIASIQPAKRRQLSALRYLNDAIAGICGQQRKYFDREYRRVHTYRARDGFVTLNQYTIREEIDAYATEMQDLHHRVRESPVYASTWAE